MIGPKFVEHGIGAPGRIGIAQVAGGRELVQHDVIARVALEFRERRVEPHGRARRVEMLEREPRVAAPDRQDREPGLRLRMACGRGGDFTEVQGRQRFDAEVEAEVTQSPYRSAPALRRGTP